jgi:hypothetical protein
MDTKLIKQYGEDILCYRLRTARQKKRMQYEDFDKYLIQLDKKERALNQKKRNLGWEPLVPPVQKGWKRFYVLRDDVAAGKHAEFFQAILNKINTYDWSHRKDFVIRRRKFGKKVYVVRKQKLKEPRAYEFFKMDFNNRERLLFDEIDRIDQSGRRLEKKYVFRESWRFRLKVGPNIISKVRIKDGMLESEIKRIDNYMERNDLRKRQERITRGYFKYRYWDELEKYDEINPFLNKPIRRILGELKAEL